jgi:hypothetical protein
MSKIQPQPQSEEIDIPEDPPPQSSTSKSKKELEDLFGHQTSKALHRVRIGIIYIGGFVGIVVVLIRIWHLCVPQWGWLCEVQVSEMDQVLFSGLVGAIVGRKIDQHFFSHR